MRKHFATLFDAVHRKKTIRFAIISVFMNVGSVFIGTTDNIPGILMLIGGMCCLIFTFVNPWKRGKNYAIMAGLSIVLIMITFGMIKLMASLGYEQYISDGAVMSIIGLFCIPGIIVGVIGSIIYGEKSRPLNIPNFPAYHEGADSQHRAGIQP